MKTSVYLKATALAVIVGSMSPVAKAGSNHHESEKILQQNEEERYVMVTGSHIPQRIKLKSIGTDTPYNLRIYSKRELESTGRQTPGGALAAIDPSITLSRGR